MNETSSRLLKLLALLQGRRDWAGAELAERLEISERTVRRDVERLRDLGYPVESVRGPGGRYTLRAGTAMPPLLLDEDEAIAIAVGLGTAARSSVTGIEETAVRALVKLEQVLPAHLRRRVAALSAATVAPPAAGPLVDPGHLTAIAAACRDNECLRFAYTSRTGEDTRREVEPHSLVNRGSRWYLVAYDRRREDWRTFRLDRLQAPASTGVRFEPRELPAPDASAYVERSIAARPSRYEARVTLHASAEEMARRVPPYWGGFEPIDENRCEFRARDDDLGWLATRIAMLGVDFDLHGPPELRDHLRAQAERLARAAAQPPNRG
ncbi:MAG TPA: YafY family protein [Solirubrobacterales bacterium]|nr:YafY family protein [Solirubrobacterales bacterium]